MELEDTVCGFHRSKELVDRLGVYLDTIYYWYTPDGYQNERKLIHRDYVPENANGYPYFPAPTVAELGVLLPAKIKEFDYWFLNICKNSQGAWMIDYRQDTDQETWIIREWEFEPCFSLVQALANALIWLLEHNFVKVKDLKL